MIVSPVASSKLRKTKGTASFVVAASDALPEIKRIADYVCDGTADQVGIQAVIDALPANGGAVFLSAGTFYKNNVTPIALVSNCELHMTPGTIIQLTANPGNDPEILKADGKTNILITGGILDGNKAAQTTITGVAAKCINFTGVTESRILNVCCKNPGTSDALSGYGIYLNASSRNQIFNNLLLGARRENLVLYNTSDYNVVAHNIAKDSVAIGTVTTVKPLFKTCF